MTNAEKMELVQEYRTAQTKLRELRGRYKTVGKDVFKAEAVELFEAHPDLIDFGWRQYTPGFNDGDPCTFQCYKDSPMVNGVDEWEDNPDGEYPDLTEAQREVLMNAVGSLLDKYTENDLEALFGDCVRVTVTRKGIETDYYQPS